MKLYTAVLAALFFIFTIASCQSTSKKAVAHTHFDTRSPASKNNYERFERIFSGIFAKLTQEYEATNGNLDTMREQFSGTENDPFNGTSNKILARSYFLMQEFDKKLEELHKSCLLARGENPQADCPSIMDDDNYIKLWASRIANERQKARMVYHYLRMLDILDWSPGSFFFVDTDIQMRNLRGIKNAQAKEIADFMLSTWDKNLSDLIQAPDRLSNPIFYELVVEIYNLKELARQTFNQAKGKPPYEIQTVGDLGGRTVREYFEEKAKQIKEFAEESADIEDDDSVIEIFDDIKEGIVQSNRTPQSVTGWKNHNGKAFNKGEWAITYDDGPGKQTTKDIVDILGDTSTYKNKTKTWHATFFWLAKNASSQTSSVNKVIAAGHGVASHSYTHANLGKSSANLDKEITRAQRDLASVYSDESKKLGGGDLSVNFFRLPYGAGTKRNDIQKLVVQLGMEHFFWNVDTLDWKNSTPQAIYDRTKKQMDQQGRGIILFHDIHKRTVETTRLMAKNMGDNLNVIKLEDGNGIGKSANSGKKPSGGTSNPQPTPPPVAVNGTLLYINVSNILNVRENGKGTPACGQLQRGDIVTARGTDSFGWYMIDVHNSSSTNMLPFSLGLENASEIERARDRNSTFPSCKKSQWAFISGNPNHACVANAARNGCK